MQFYIENIVHLVPYAILLAIYLYLCLQSEIQNSRLLFAAPVIGVLLFFAGCREAMTPDLRHYKELYEVFNHLEASSIEPSFLLLSKVLNWLGFDYHALYLVYSFITLLFIYLGIRSYTNHVKLSLLLYVLIPNCFLNMFVEMREVCTIAIVFYATGVLRSENAKHRIAKTIALALLSIMFHYSAILYWVVVLLSYKFIKRMYPKMVYFAFITTSLLIPTSALVEVLRLAIYPFAPAKYRGYIEFFLSQDIASSSGQLLKSLIYVLLAVSFVLWQSLGQNKERDRDSQSDPVLLNLFVIGVIILNLSRSFADVSRIAYYFLIQQIVIFPLLLDQVNGRVKRLLAAYCVFLFYLGQFAWGLFYYSIESGTFVFLHYQNVFLSAL